MNVDYCIAGLSKSMTLWGQLDFDLLFLLLLLLFAFGWQASPLCACFCAGIRVTLACFKRCPCAGRHLLFFAAAKKSRQKKAAHTANS
ncbi:hypothetical protein [Paraburkholderia caribensis]|uniref:hypothetical protein n=1 Tax=Paraburkholderia caribensis TaxID=75105 RepID=UPI00159FE572|nr:hypothetical protein [Paraburkholderia caribensis]MCO4881701.1 hypothetical protein [Paraburkholderia caribensis]